MINFRFPSSCYLACSYRCESQKLRDNTLPAREINQRSSKGNVQSMNLPRHSYVNGSPTPPQLPCQLFQKIVHVCQSSYLIFFHLSIQKYNQYHVYFCKEEQKVLKSTKQHFKQGKEQSKLTLDQKLLLFKGTHCHKKSYTRCNSFYLSLSLI